MQPGPTAIPHIPLTPAVFHIALALARGPLHGYGVMLEVERLTHGIVKLGPGTLYRSIQRMRRDGLIEEVELGPVDAEDERRRYYRLTETGTAVVRAEAGRLLVLVEAARARGLLQARDVQLVEPAEKGDSTS